MMKVHESKTPDPSTKKLLPIATIFRPTDSLLNESYFQSGIKSKTQSITKKEIVLVNETYLNEIPEY